MRWAGRSVIFRSRLSRKARPTMTPRSLQAPRMNSTISTQKDYPKLLDVTVYSDEITAKHDLAKGVVTAVIVFPSEVSNDHAIRLYVDSSNSITPALVESALNGVLASLMANNPVLINKIYGDIKYIQFFGVGVIMMAIFTSTMFGGGIALIKDRENGIHEGIWLHRSSVQASSPGSFRAEPSGHSLRVLPSFSSISSLPASSSRASRISSLSYW